MGTPTYMSPEQARGETADYRSDIFSFGVVLYEMATGQLPFKEASKAETMNAVINKAHRPIREINEDMPEGLSAVIDRALAKQADDRYQSIEKMIGDLRRVAQEAGVAGGNTPDGAVVPYVMPERKAVHKLSRRARSLAVLALAAVIATGVTIAILMSLNKQPATAGPIRSIAVLPFKLLDASSRDESLEMGMANTLVTKLGNLSQVRVRSIESVSRYAALDTDSIEAGKQLQVDAVLYGHIQRSGERIRVTVHFVRVSDGTLLWSDTLDDAYVDIFAVRDSISEKVVSALALKLSGEERQRLAKHPADNAEAYKAYNRGRYHLDKKMPREVENSIQYFQQAIDSDPNYAQAHAGIAEAYFSLGGLGARPPNDAIPRAKMAVTRVLALDNLLAEAYASRGIISHRYDWDRAGVESDFKKSIQLNPDVPTTRRHYALYLLDKGLFDDALAAIKKALELRPLDAIVNRDVGQVLFYSRRYDEAINALNETLELDRIFLTAYGFLARL